MRLRHASFTVLLGCFVAQSAPSQATYTIVDLGAVEGSTSAVPVAMNALGDCVGWSTVVSAQHAFLYTDATGMVDLGNLPGGNVSAISRGINELREVVGESTWVEWRWSPSTGMVEYAPSFWTGPTSINNSGVIVGSLSPGTFSPSPFFFKPSVGVVQFAGAVWGNATDVNESGVVVGTWGGTSSSIFDPVTGSQPLPALPNYPWNYPVAINERGQVAGNASPVTGFSTWFRYTPGVGIEDIGRPDPSFQASAVAMNNRGEIVGSMNLNPDVAYLYTDQGGFQNLNAMVPAGSGYRLQAGVAINDAGQILCQAYNSSLTSYRAVRLDPVSLQAAVKSVGTGCGADLPPKLTGNLPVLGGTLSSSLTGASPFTSGFLFLSAVAPLATDFGLGCTVYFDLAAPMAALPITTDSAGSATFATPLPGTAALAGIPLTTQVILFGTAGPRGLDFSNGFLQRLGS